MRCGRCGRGRSPTPATRTRPRPRRRPGRGPPGAVVWGVLGSCPPPRLVGRARADELHPAFAPVDAAFSPGVRASRAVAPHAAVRAPSIMAAATARTDYPRMVVFLSDSMRLGRLLAQPDSTVRRWHD